MKNNKGITVIALIITIILMLILVSVGVKIAINGSLIETTADTANRWSDKVVQYNNKADNLIGILDGEVNDNPNCSHSSYSSWTITREATCITAGSQKRTCNSCGHEETQIIDALGHNFVNGTCTRCGATQTCSHSSYSSWSITTEATCITAGIKKRTCNTCGYEDTQTIAATGHSWSSTTGKCTKCGESCSHSYGSWTTTTAATCTTAGSQMRTCSICNKVEIQPIAIKGHTWSSSTGKCTTCGASCSHSYGSWTTTTAATCTSAGSKKRTCSICGYVETQTIAATGHSWSSSTGKCSNCGVYCSHSSTSTSTITSASCTSSGSGRETCNTCGYSTTYTISALGHSWGSWTTTSSATCGSSGSKKRTCSRCSATETETIAATGNHTFNGYTTCRTCGYECTHPGLVIPGVCSTCGVGINSPDS